MANSIDAFMNQLRSVGVRDLVPCKTGNTFHKVFLVISPCDDFYSVQQKRKYSPLLGTDTDMGTIKKRQYSVTLRHFQQTENNRRRHMDREVENLNLGSYWLNNTKEKHFVNYFL